MKLKELIQGWPLDGWARGSLAWDNDPGILKLTAVTEPGAAGTFELVSIDAQLCRWSNSLVVADPAYHAATSAALAGAIGRTLADVGEVDIGL